MKKNEISILLVEDDEFYASLIIEYLSEEGFKDIRYAKSGVECMIEVFEERMPDIVIMDYQLVNLDGLKIMERLLKYRSDLNIIIMSTQQDIQVAIRAMKMGAVDYFIKDENLFPKISQKLNQYSSSLTENKRSTKIRKFLSDTREAYNETFLGISKS